MRYRSEINDLIVKSTLKRQAKEYFLGLKRVKETTGYKSGRLDTSRLSSVMNRRVDVFKRKEDVRMVNSAVSILVDSSGSMSGECYALACASAVMLAECLTAVGVQVEVAGFTEWSGDRLVHALHCQFGQRFNRAKTIDDMVALGDKLRQNADGESIMVAYDRLIQVDTDKRVLIVLSDGGPCDDQMYDSEEVLREVCKFVERDGKRTNTALWGIGIGGSTAVRRFYSNTVIVDDDNRIGDALLTLIKQSVTIK